MPPTHAVAQDAGGPERGVALNLLLSLSSFEGLLRRVCSVPIRKVIKNVPVQTVSVLLASQQQRWDDDEEIVKYYK